MGTISIMKNFTQQKMQEIGYEKAGRNCKILELVEKYFE